MSYTIDLDGQKMELTIKPSVNTLSLARTGAQGAKGTSISTVAINTDGELLVTLVDGAGNVIEVVNAGNIDLSNFSMNDLSEINVTNSAQGEVLVYNSTTENYENQLLTTADIKDIDDTGKVDGSILMYDTLTQKYLSTQLLDAGAY
jgi:hypothetical protein